MSRVTRTSVLRLQVTKVKVRKPSNAHTLMYRFHFVEMVKVEVTKLVYPSLSARDTGLVIHERRDD